MFKLKKASPMLKAADIQRTIDFYTNTLGFTLDSAWPENDPKWCSLDHGEVHLMFYIDKKNADSSINMSGHLYLQTENVMALYEKIKNDVEVLWGPEVYHYGMREFAVKECNGYTLAFGEPTDDPPTCPVD